MRTKRQNKTKSKNPGRANAKYPVSAAHLRLYALTAIVIFSVSLILLTSGSAHSRMSQLALPLLIGANTREKPADDILDMDEGASEPEPITITRVDVDEGVGDRLRIEVLNPKTPVSTALSGEEPRVLIYHTHTTEAYRQTDTYKYEENGEWRTKEQDKSVVAVGGALTKLLREQYGCNVIHDTTDHEPPKLATSYSRSLETILEYKRRYPSLELYIDLHRDAGKNPSFTVIDGKRVAKMMFVVGTGEGATGTGYAEMPNFQSNFALANAITENIRAVSPDLMRNIRVKTSRYNQHVSDHCLLVEVGDNMSTLEEAMNAIPYLAKAIVETLSSAAGETSQAPQEELANQEASAPANDESIWAPNGR